MCSAALAVCVSWRDADLVHPHAHPHPDKVRRDDAAHRNHSTGGMSTNKGTAGVTTTATTTTTATAMATASQEGDSNRTRATGRDGGGAGALSPTGRQQ